VLNASDNVLEEGYEINIDDIRRSFVYKIVERFDEKYGMEDHLNA
jgi:hypothetical protein